MYKKKYIMLFLLYKTKNAKLTTHINLNTEIKCRSISNYL